MIDLTYRRNGMFTRFMAHTPDGVTAWRQIDTGICPVGEVLSSQLAATLAQLRAAGYSVQAARYTKSSKSSKEDDAALAAELSEFA